MTTAQLFPTPLPAVRFTAFGIPQPQGSMTALPCLRCGAPGRMMPSNRKTGPWRKAIRRALDAEDLQPIAGPVRVSLLFQLPRPKGHHGARGILPSAPAYPAVKPDVDKLARAALDALTDGRAFGDDAQVVELIVLKHYATGTPGVEIRVEALA